MLGGGTTGQSYRRSDCLLGLDVDGKVRGVKNAVLVDFTVCFLDCLWGTPIHRGEQCSHVGQLVSKAQHTVTLEFYHLLLLPVLILRHHGIILQRFAYHLSSIRGSIFPSPFGLTYEVRGHCCTV